MESNTWAEQSEEACREHHDSSAKRSRTSPTISFSLSREILPEISFLPSLLPAKFLNDGIIISRDFRRIEDANKSGHPLRKV